MTNPNQPKYSPELLSRLPPQSLQITTETQRVRYNGELPEVDRLYLQINGTPDAFRYLSTVLLELANRAEKSQAPIAGASVILDPADLKPLVLSEWDAMDVGCRKQLG